MNSSDWKRRSGFPEASSPGCEQLLAALYGTGVTSLAQLSRQLGASLDRVRQLLAELSTSGCRLEISPGGVHLETVSWPWWRAILERRSAQCGRQLGRHTLVFAQTTSTNDICRQLAPGLPSGRPAAGLAEPLVVLADWQSAGRGRGANRWVAKPGQSILMSVWLPGRPPDAQRLTLAAGLACARCLESLTGQNAELQWPNDVRLSGRKVAGILCETRPAAAAETALYHYTIGIGLNVAQQPLDFPPELRVGAGSLLMATGRHWSRLPIIDELLDQLERLCVQPVSPEEIAAAWKSRCAMLADKVTIHCAGRSLTGRVADIDPLRGLVLRDAQGHCHFCSAEQSRIIQVG